ncbi:hypothetical protein D3C72_1952240 [compost metagenome]
MYKMLQPSAASWRKVVNSFSTAPGVSTDVGSSRISSCGLASKARTISTRWHSPTDKVWTWRCGSRSRPYWRAVSSMRCASSAMLVPAGKPRAMFSVTVKVSNREKCWNTMAMPSARAADGLAISTSRPFHRMRPPSGCTAP